MNAQALAERTTPRIFGSNAGLRSKLAKVQDVKLSARSLYERAVALQAIPLHPECADYRAECERQYEVALAELIEAANG